MESFERASMRDAWVCPVVLAAERASIAREARPIVPPSNTVEIAIATTISESV